MANRIKIATIGAKAKTGNPGTGDPALEAMMDHWRSRFDQVWPGHPDIVVVPECCDRYPAHSPEERRTYYRHRGDSIRDFFAQMAREHRCYITYPAVREMSDGSWRNSLQMLDRNGDVTGVYDKNFPVITETTDAGILCGSDAPLIECDFGRVGVAICFDLNFSEIRQRYEHARPNLLIFPSMYHGGLMQAYWAYACRAHLVTAVCGLPSAILSPVGNELASTTNYFDFVISEVNLDCQIVHLDFNWDKLRAMRARYGTEVSVFDPGYLGSVLISSESEERSSADLIAEFEVELLDDYMRRSMAHRNNLDNVGKMS